MSSPFTIQSPVGSERRGASRSHPNERDGSGQCYNERLQEDFEEGRRCPANGDEANEGGSGRDPTTVVSIAKEGRKEYANSEYSIPSTPDDSEDTSAYRKTLKKYRLRAEGSCYMYSSL